MPTLAYALLLGLVFRPDLRTLGVFSILAFALFFANGAEAGHGWMDVSVYAITQTIIFGGVGFLIVAVREFVGPRPKSNSTPAKDTSESSSNNDANS